MSGRSQADVLDVVRASSGTYQDGTGATVTAGINELRVGWRWSTTAAAWVIAGMLLEATATQFSLNSNDLSLWSGRQNIQAGNVNKIIEDTTTGRHQTSPAGSTTAVIGSSYCGSIIASEIPGSAKRYLIIFFGGAENRGAAFDLATGTVTSMSSNVTAGAIPWGPGQWLCWAAIVSSTTNAIAPSYWLSTAGSTGAATNGYAGDGASGVNASDAQFELGNYPTSRIRSGATQVTRAADIVSKTVDSWFDPNSFTVLFRYFPAANPAVNTAVATWHSGSSHRVSLIHTITGSLVLELVSNGAGTGGGLSMPLTIGADNRIAFGVGKLASRMAINGVATSGVMGTKIEAIATRRWGNNRSGGSQPNAYLMPFLSHPSGERQFDASEYPRLLSIDEMKALTA